MIYVCGGSHSKGSGILFGAYTLFTFSYLSYVPVCKSERFTFRYLLAFSRLSLTREEQLKRSKRDKRRGRTVCFLTFQ